MEDVILAVVERRGGYAFRADLLDAGLNDRDIALAVRHGLLQRLRHGTYAPVSLVDGLSRERRHLLVAYSIIDKLGPGVALSHHTAAIAHSRVSYGVDLSTIHLTRLGGRGSRTEAGVTFHVGSVVPDDDLCVIDGRLAVVPARAVIESCSLASIESGMVTASFALREGVCTIDELRERMRCHERWPGMRRVRLSLAMAEPRCESVGEVRSMYMFSCTGIPRPEPQFEVTRRGVVLARTDFGWRACRHVGEFDGLIKYGRLNPYSDAHLGQVLVAEKRREDEVREEDLGMSRWIWRDLDAGRWGATGARIQAGMERSRRLFARNVCTSRSGPDVTRQPSTSPGRSAVRCGGLPTEPGKPRPREPVGSGA